MGASGLIHKVMYCRSDSSFNNIGWALAHTIGKKDLVRTAIDDRSRGGLTLNKLPDCMEPT